MFSEYYHSISVESSRVLQKSRVLRSRDFCDRRANHQHQGSEISSSSLESHAKSSFSCRFLLPTVWTWCSKSKFSRKLKHLCAGDGNACSRNARLESSIFQPAPLFHAPRVLVRHPVTFYNPQDFLYSFVLSPRADFWGFRPPRSASQTVVRPADFQLGSSAGIHILWVAI